MCTLNMNGYFGELVNTSGLWDSRENQLQYMNWLVNILVLNGGLVSDRWTTF